MRRGYSLGERLLRPAWSRSPTRSARRPPAAAAAETSAPRAARGWTGEFEGLDREGLLRRFWASPSPPPRTRSRRPTASSPASCTPTTTPATRRPRSRFKAVSEAYDVLSDDGTAQGVRRDALAVRRRARSAQRAGRRPGPGGPGSTSPTCSPGGRAVRRRVPVSAVTAVSAAPASRTCSARSSPVAAAPDPRSRRPDVGPGPRRRDRGGARLRATRCRAPRCR